MTQNKTKNIAKVVLTSNEIVAGSVRVKLSIRKNKTLRNLRHRKKHHTGAQRRIIDLMKR